MMVMRRLAAAFALVALLACSSAGTCWAQLAAASEGHECCPPSGRSTLAAPAKACASPIAAVGPVGWVPAPFVSATPGPLVSATWAAPATAFPSAFPVLRPPLILRI
jgi:hypothetical protein